MVLRIDFCSNGCFFLLTTLWLFICSFLRHLGEPCTGTSLPLRRSRRPRSAVTKVNVWLLHLVIVESNPVGDPNINIADSVLQMFTDLLLIYVTLFFKWFYQAVVNVCTLMSTDGDIYTNCNFSKFSEAPKLVPVGFAAVTKLGKILDGKLRVNHVVLLVVVVPFLKEREMLYML